MDGANLGRLQIVEGTLGKDRREVHDDRHSLEAAAS